MRRVIILLSLCGLTDWAYAQSIQRVYGSPCTGIEMVFQFMGNCTVNYWTVNAGGTITYTSPDKKSIKVRYNSPTTAFVSADYMNCGSGVATYPPFAVSAPVTPTISISATTSTTVYRTCAVSFTASITNGGSSPSISWYKNGVYQAAGASFTHASFNSGDMVQAQLYSNFPCLTTTTVMSNSLYVTVNEVSVHRLSGSDACPEQTTSIYLSGSQSGVTYTLYRNSISVSSTAGSGSVLRWDNQPVGTYSVTATVCSASVPMENAFTVNQRSPGGITISTSVPPLLCSGASITLTANGGYAHVWRRGAEVLGSGTSITLSPSYSQTIQLEGRESVCGIQTYANIFIDVSSPTVGGTTYGAQTGLSSNTVCSGTFGQTTLAAGTYVGTILNWEYSFAGANGPYTNWYQPGQSTTAESCCMGQEGETIHIRAQIKNGYCPAVPSAPTSYYWKPKPAAPSLPQTGRADTKFCQGTSVKFNSTAQEGTIVWTVTGTGNTIDQSGNVRWANDFSGAATVSVQTSNQCGSSPVAFTEVLIDRVSQGGNALASSTQGSYVLVDKKDFGKSTLVSQLGGVIRWEYSRDPSAGWTDWGQIDRLTTTETCCIDQPGNSVWVRAVVRNGECPEQSSSAVRYSWGDEEQNFIRAYTARIPMSSIDSVYDLSSDKTKVMLQSQYFDGLGRVSQVISKSFSPAGRDMVEFHEYDNFGRELVKHLPYEATSTLGYFQSNAKANQAAFYSPATADPLVPRDLFPYSVSGVESSPLNRILKQGAPGGDWQPGEGEDHTVKSSYRFNYVNEVLLWKVDAGTGLVTVTSGSSLRYYPANELRAVATVDENGSEVIEFTDKLGRTVLKRVQRGGSGAQRTYADTYYIYDDAGNLRVVVPPEAVANVSLLTTHY